METFKKHNLKTLFKIMLGLCLTFTTQAQMGFTDPIFYDLYFDDGKQLQYKKNCITLAALIHSECGICDQDEMIYVGATVLHRMEKRDLTLHEVVHQKSQYAGVKTQHFYPTEKTLKIAKHLLNPESIIPVVEYFVTKEIRDSCFAKDMPIRYIGRYHYYF
jgi:hypothetical protein